MPNCFACQSIFAASAFNTRRDDSFCSRFSRYAVRMPFAVTSGSAAHSQNLASLPGRLTSDDFIERWQKYEPAKKKSADANKDHAKATVAKLKVPENAATEPEAHAMAAERYKRSRPNACVSIKYMSERMELSRKRASSIAVLKSDDSIIFFALRFFRLALLLYVRIVRHRSELAHDGFCEIEFGICFWWL